MADDARQQPVHTIEGPLKARDKLGVKIMAWRKYATARARALRFAETLLSSFSPSPARAQHMCVITPAASAHVDAAAIKAFVLRVQLHEYGINDPAHLHDLDDVEAAYTRDGGGLWVATNDDGAPVGTIALHALGDAGMIKRLYVDAAYRGAQHGTSQALLHTLLEHARRHAMQHVYLGARITGPSAAARFFRKHGFSSVERTALPPGAPVSAHDTHFFMRTLN